MSKPSRTGVDDLRGVSRPVEQHRRGDERGTLEKWRATPVAETRTEPRSAETAMAPAFSAPATAKTGTTETGPAEAAEARPAKAGSAEAAEESNTRHRCRSFPHGTIKFLDTTDRADVNEIDGCLRGTAWRVPACGA